MLPPSPLQSHHAPTFSCPDAGVHRHTCACCVLAPALRQAPLSASLAWRVCVQCCCACMSAVLLCVCVALYVCSVVVAAQPGAWCSSVGAVRGLARMQESSTGWKTACRVRACSRVLRSIGRRSRMTASEPPPPPLFFSPGLAPRRGRACARIEIAACQIHTAA